MQTFSNGIWQNIRLELAPTPEFPEGSASRAYILCLPVREDGTVDVQALETMPAMARFKRFWPNEADRTGHVARQGDGWVLTFTAADGSESVFPIELDRLLPGEEVAIEKKCRGRWLFRVVDLKLSPSA